MAATEEFCALALFSNAVPILALLSNAIPTVASSEATFEAVTARAAERSQVLDDGEISCCRLKLDDGKRPKHCGDSLRERLRGEARRLLSNHSGVCRQVVTHSRGR